MSKVSIVPDPLELVIKVGEQTLSKKVQFQWMLCQSTCRRMSFSLVCREDPRSKGISEQ